MTIRLYTGDCLKLLAKLPAGSIDAVVTDPPYGINYTPGGGGRGRHHRWNLAPIIGDDKPFNPAGLLDYPCVLWGANHYAAALPRGSWMAWDKSCGKGPADSFVDCEFAWSNKPGVKRNVFRCVWKGIIRGTENGQPRFHPSQKPIALMRWSIERLNLKPGSTILDPYMGSGSVGVAATQLGYNFIGIDIDPSYVALARRRIKAERAKVQVSA